MGVKVGSGVQIWKCGRTVFLVYVDNGVSQSVFGKISVDVINGWPYVEVWKKKLQSFDSATTDEVNF